MNNYEKALSDAEKDLAKYVEREDWGTANQKKGYRDGIVSYKHDFEYDKKWDANFAYTNVEDTEKELKRVVEREDYGQAAYILSWLSGRMRAQTAMRLDELEAIVK